MSTKELTPKTGNVPMNTCNHSIFHRSVYTNYSFSSLVHDKTTSTTHFDTIIITTATTTITQIMALNGATLDFLQSTQCITNHVQHARKKNHATKFVQEVQRNSSEFQLDRNLILVYLLMETINHRQKNKTTKQQVQCTYFFSGPMRWLTVLGGSNPARLVPEISRDTKQGNMSTSFLRKLSTSG